MALAEMRSFRKKRASTAAMAGYRVEMGKA